MAETNLAEADLCCVGDGPRWWRRVFVGVIVVSVVSGAGWWWQRHAVAKWVPERPEGQRLPAEFSKALDQAEAEARSGEVRGLASLATLYHANGFPAVAGGCYAGLIELEPGVAKWAERRALLDRDSLPDAGVEDGGFYDVCFSPERLIEAAGAAAGRGKAKDALRWLGRALAIEPECGLWHLRAAEIHETLRDQVTAKAEYERAVALDGHLPEAWLRLVGLRMAIGEIGPAMRTLDDGLAANPDAVILLMARGQREWQLGRSENALADFGRVIDLAPDSADGFLAASQVLFALDRREEAIARLTEAVAAEPHNPASLLLLCVAAVEANDRPEADRWWDAARSHPRVRSADLAQVGAAYEKVFGERPPAIESER